MDEEKSKTWCEPPYGLVPCAIYSVGLSLEAISLYVSICTFANGKTGEAFPKRDKLMEKCGIRSTATFAKRLKELEEAGVVKTTRSRQGRGGAFKSNHYQLIDPASLLSEGDDVINIRTWSRKGQRKDKKE